MEQLPAHFSLAQRIARDFSSFSQVTAVGLGGSLVSGKGENNSDIDLYIFTSAAIPLTDREILAHKNGAVNANMDLNYWDPGDEWFDGETGIEVDVMYWHPDWITEQVEKTAIRCEAAMGYTTCFWHTVRNLQVLFDRSGWLAGLKRTAESSYPEQLRVNIIQKNHPLLHHVIPAYTHQIEKAVERKDWISVNHRLAAYLASYFDIIFALNRVLHPGEKRLLQHAIEQCPLRPPHLAEDLSALLVPDGEPGADWLAALSGLNAEMDAMLKSAGF